MEQTIVVYNQQKYPLLSDDINDFDRDIEKLNTCKSIKHLRQEITSIINTLGFKDYLFIRLNRNWHTGTQYGLLSSLPEAFLDAYISDKLYKHDQILNYCKENLQPIFSSLVYDFIDSAPFETALTRNNRLVLNTYRRHGYHEQYIVPARASNGHGNVMLAVMMQGASKEDLRAKATTMGPLCRALCKAIDSVTTKRFHTQFIGRREAGTTLPNRARVALQNLASSDCRVTDIAEQMGISSITLHQHFANARNTLGVKTNIAAIVKAANLNLISLDHDDQQ